jgi:hypothetical protein
MWLKNYAIFVAIGLLVRFHDYLIFEKIDLWNTSKLKRQLKSGISPNVEFKCYAGKGKSVFRPGQLPKLRSLFLNKE